MNRKALLLVALVTVAPTSALAANTPVVHVDTVFSAYEGDAHGKHRIWSGYVSAPSVAANYPGTLVIEPGDANWANYVGAARAPVPYAITSVTMVKQTPALGICSDVFPAKKITQTGAENIRLNWPLTYEVAGTVWELTIRYDTPTLWDDDGKGPNQPSLNHTELWVWPLQADLPHLRSLLRLLHDVPVGTSGVPAISDETLYADLTKRFDQAAAAWEAGDSATAAEILVDAELAIMDACRGVAPSSPYPTGPETGVIGSLENPAFCKLISEIEASLPGG